MSGTLTIFRRELRSYFATPVAYVFIVIFLLMSGALTFYLGNFYERGQADLQPFFNFHPWLYLFLVPAVSMRMYDRIRSEAQGNVLDLFSGVGSITLYAAKNASHVTGVEIVEESVASARANAERNNVCNVEFIARDALDYMKENKGTFDTVILDPPRSGAHPKAIKALEEMAPPKIVYMSCNPSTFRENLELLPSYEIVSFEAHDMFPLTPHVESLAVLKRKD